MGRQFTKDGDLQPYDGMTQRQRRLSNPLPNYPMKWLKLDDAKEQGYSPFAGFFLPHEYPMMAGFLRDLDAAKREYCGVRDIKHAKGVSIFAKNIRTNGDTNTTEADAREATETTEATKIAIAEGFQEARDAESSLREVEGDLASGEDRD